MVPEYGSGPSLTQDLDVTVDGTGDLNTDSGRAEFEKDLSFRLLLAFDNTEQGVLDPATREEIRITARDAVSADERTDDVLDVSVFEGDGVDRINVGVTVRADDDEIQLVETVQ